MSPTPSSGSNHNRGGAVDLTLVNLATGQELLMPTAFDYFGNEAAHGWTIGLSAEQVANRELLLAMMENVGGTDAVRRRMVALPARAVAGESAAGFSDEVECAPSHDKPDVPRVQILSE